MASSAPCRAFKSTIMSAAGLAAADFQELLAGRHRFQRDSGCFAVSMQLRLKEKIIDQYNCIGHEFLSSQYIAIPMYHARRRNTSRNRCFDHRSVSSPMTIPVQASPVFSVPPLCPLC